MARGIDLTLQVVAKSKNRAAAEVLESALQSTHEAVRKLAGTIIVSKRSRQGLETIIRTFDPADSNLVKLVNDNRAKLIPGLHGTIVADDVDLARQAFLLAYTQNFYEVLPSLAAYCLGPGAQERRGQTLTNDFLKFLDKFTAALAKNDPGEHQLLYNHLLPEFSKLLAQKITEYRFTRNALTLSVYLRLYPFFSDAGVDRDLYQQLRLTSSPVYVAAYRRLLKESESYLFRFITLCLDRLNPPPIVPLIVSERTDAPFLATLCKSLKKPLTLEQKTNLANLPPLAWIGQISAFLHEFDAEAQCGLVLLMQSIQLPPDELQSYLAKIFEFGSGAGRAAALSALATLTGGGIDRLIWDASADKDPAVQVEALTQLNARAIPHAASRIMQFVESPHEEVRDTIQKLLPYFRFNRFMQTFDQLDEENRRRMFKVVQQLDKQTPAELTKMLTSGEPTERTKALLCIDYGRDIVPLVEDTLCEILARDEKSLLRCKAAEHLVAGRRDESRTTLVQALHRDESPEVRAAAKTSLENRPTYWHSDPYETQK